MHLIRVEVNAYKKKQLVYTVEIAFSEMGTYMSSPTSCCTCADGPGFCSHMVCVLFFIRRIQLMRERPIREHLKLLPGPVSESTNQIVTFMYLNENM